MDKFEAEERELIRRNCFLSEYLQKEQERKEQEEIERKERIRNQKTIGLPSIDDSMKNLKEGKSLAPKYGRIFEAPAKLQRRGSVNLQLLHVVGSTSPLPTSRYYHSGSDDSRPSSAGVRLPPLREELSTNNRRWYPEIGLRIDEDFQYKTDFIAWKLNTYFKEVYYYSQTTGEYSIAGKFMWYQNPLDSGRRSFKLSFSVWDYFISLLFHKLILFLFILLIPRQQYLSMIDWLQIFRLFKENHNERSFLTSSDLKVSA